MIKLLTAFLVCISYLNLFSQSPNNYTNKAFIKFLNKDSGYLGLKYNIIKQFKKAKPGHWGEFVKGVDEDFVTSDSIIAFTFDACGGKYGSGYDKQLIEYLRKEKVPATLFITGKWIDANYNTFIELSNDTLFEIENHGYNHKPCSINGKSEYGVKGTANVSQAFDEMEGNARKIEAITKRKPCIYRSATAYIDEASTRMASILGISVVSYQVLSGDAVAYTPASVIESNVVKHVKPGSIVIMHFNHPKWYTYEAMIKIIPKLRKEGYSFAKLQDFPLTGK